MKGELTGGCLCGAVRYTLKPGMRLNPYACHCTDCQTRTGSAFSEHMLFALADLEIEGELDIAEYTQPSGAKSEIFGCLRCKARIYALNSTREGMASLRCGTLDNSNLVVPAAHIWVKSKQPWIGLPDGSATMDEQPRTTEDWINLVGLVS
ncbi:hypothetical protein BPTFM16_00682 [Altererythrobacter insulae]|nr:hypothetical protein BPTFM16_00682 [Altererythrobacter insulae]